MIMHSQQENYAEAQSTKVADTIPPTNRGDDGASNADTPHEETSSDPNTASPTAARRSPTPQSPGQPKRPASQSPSPSTKRQRTSMSPSTSHENFQHPSRQARMPSNEPRPEPRLAQARPDDKARTRRLFGGMLSTIAAKPSSRRAPYEAPRRLNPAKREELERKAAEREKVRLKEEEEARKERELMRREENRERYGRWERDTIVARFENERVRAEWLRTSGRPELYYKPYILTNDQKDTIERQVEDTELAIQKEIRQYEETHPGQDPLPWKPLATKDYIHSDDTPGNQREDRDMDEDKEVSPPPANSSKVEEQPASRLDGAEERQQEHKKERTRTDEYDEEVIETEGGVSLIY